MSGPPQVSSALLRRLTTENRTMARRLAQLEFREFLADLDNPGIFELKIDFPDWERAPPLALPSILDDPMARRLPRIAVPLGKCAWSDTPEALPAIAIHCPDIDNAALGHGLRELLRQHNAQPFGRLLFVCATLRPIPLLGRYGFAYEYVGGSPPGHWAPRLALRYGIVEARDLVSATQLWSPSSE